MLDTVALVGDAAKVYGDVAAQTVERDPPEEARTAHKGRGAKDRGGLVCLNSAARFDKWNRAAVR